VSTSAHGTASWALWPPRAAIFRQATVEDVQAALEAMRSKEDGSAVRPATVNTYVAAVKSFLGFAHRVVFTRFNAGPLIKLKKAPRQIAQRILSEVETAVLIRAAKTDRDRLMFDLAHFGGLRVSELVSLTWAQLSGATAARRSSHSSARVARTGRC